MHCDCMGQYANNVWCKWGNRVLIMHIILIIQAEKDVLHEMLQRVLAEKEKLEQTLQSTPPPLPATLTAHRQPKEFNNTAHHHAKPQREAQETKAQHHTNATSSEIDLSISDDGTTIIRDRPDDRDSKSDTTVPERKRGEGGREGGRDRDSKDRQTQPTDGHLRVLRAQQQNLDQQALEHQRAAAAEKQTRQQDANAKQHLLRRAEAEAQYHTNTTPSEKLAETRKQEQSEDDDRKQMKAEARMKQDAIRSEAVARRQQGAQLQEKVEQEKLRCEVELKAQKLEKARQEHASKKDERQRLQVKLAERRQQEQSSEGDRKRMMTEARMEQGKVRSEAAARRQQETEMKANTIQEARQEQAREEEERKRLEVEAREDQDKKAAELNKTRQEMARTEVETERMEAEAKLHAAKLNKTRHELSRKVEAEAREERREKHLKAQLRESQLKAENLKKEWQEQEILLFKSCVIEELRRSQGERTTPHPAHEGAKGGMAKEESKARQGQVSQSISVLSNTAQDKLPPPCEGSTSESQHALSLSRSLSLCDSSADISSTVRTPPSEREERAERARRKLEEDHLHALLLAEVKREHLRLQSSLASREEQEIERAKLHTASEKELQRRKEVKHRLDNCWKTDEQKLSAKRQQGTREREAREDMLLAQEVESMKCEQKHLRIELAEKEKKETENKEKLSAQRLREREDREKQVQQVRQWAQSSATIIFDKHKSKDGPAAARLDLIEHLKTFYLEFVPNTPMLQKSADVIDKLQGNCTSLKAALANKYGHTISEIRTCPSQSKWAKLNRPCPYCLKPGASYVGAARPSSVDVNGHVGDAESREGKARASSALSVSWSPLKIVGKVQSHVPQSHVGGASFGSPLLLAVSPLPADTRRAPPS